MIKKLYGWFHTRTSRADERGEYSAGRWQDIVRTKVAGSCRQDTGRVLEVGCGEGLFLNQLSSQNPAVKLWGIDTSPERIAQAQKRLPAQGAQLFVADASSLPFPDGYFDTVVCINVIFNLPSETVAKNVLKEMRRVCKSAGTVIFDFRNAANPFLALKYKLAPLYDETVKNLALKTYTLVQITSWMRQLDLEIVVKESIGALLGFMPAIILIKAKKT